MGPQISKNYSSQCTLGGRDISVGSPGLTRHYEGPGERFLSSNSEARRALVENSISINKNKVDQNYIVSEKDLIRNKYVIINRGKKKTFILRPQQFLSSHGPKFLRKSFLTSHKVN